MILSLLTQPRNAAIAGLSLALLTTTGLWQLERANHATTRAKLTAAAQRVLQADETVKQAANINRRQAEAIERHRTALRAAATAAQELERRRAEQAEKAREAAAAARRRDQVRRASADLPPIEVMNAALRDAASGL